MVQNYVVYIKLLLAMETTIFLFLNLCFSISGSSNFLHFILRCSKQLLAECLLIFSEDIQYSFLFVWVSILWILATTNFCLRILFNK